MIRIPYPADLNDTTRRHPRTLEQAFGPYQRQSPIVPMAEHSPPSIWPFLFICGLAIVLALLTGCSGADASEQPSAAQLHAKQEQRRAIAAAQMCGPGKVAIWLVSTQVLCLREVSL